MYERKFSRMQLCAFSTTQTLKFQLYRTKATRFCHQNLQSMHIYFRLLLENQNINDN